MNIKNNNKQKNHRIKCLCLEVSLEELQNWGLWMVYIKKYITETQIHTHLGMGNGEKEGKHVKFTCLTI